MSLAGLKAEARRLLVGVKDLREAAAGVEACSEEEAARGHCLTWRYLAQHHAGDDLADGLELVRWYETIVEPTPAQTRRFLRLLYEAWNDLDPDRGLPFYDVPPDLPEGEG
jgi:hypothetical protein